MTASAASFSEGGGEADLGGGGFTAFNGAAHVAGVATRDRPDVVNRMLSEIEGIIDDREEVTEPAARKALAQRAYATLDLTAQYKIGKRTRVALDVENVFNKYYKTMPDIHVYGTPRSITASLRYTFD